MTTTPATDDPLFAPADFALLRAPVLPVDAPVLPAGPADDALGSALGPAADEPSAPGEPGPLRRAVLGLTADPLVAEALALSSPSLADRLDGLSSGRPATLSELRRRLRAVARYRVRMAGRATPFGLMAGVAPVRFADTPRVRFAAAHRKAVQPDAAWVAALAAQWERRPAILAGLRLSANGLCVRRGDRLVLPYVTTAAPDTVDERPADEVSVRRTDAVRAALDCARTPVTHAELTARMRARLPEPPPGAVEGVIAELVARSFLLTDLPPAPDAPDPLRHLTDRLAAVPAAAEETARLREVTEDLAAYRARPPGGGLPQLRAAVRRMRALRPCECPVTADLALDADLVLPHAVAREAARATGLLWRTGPPAGARRPLAAYHAAFLHRYGTERAVPLPELLDPVDGLGPPASPAPPAGGDGRRDRVLLALAEEAVLSGLGEIDLTDGDVTALRDDTGTPPPSAEAVFHLLATSPDALARGDFTLVMSPLTGAWPAGALWGRFASLLPGADQRLRDLAAPALTGGPAGAEDAPLPVQLVFRPRDARCGNVIRTPRWVGHVHAPGTFGERSAAGALGAEDLAVVAAPDRLRLVSPTHGGREVAASAFHMLNTGPHAPAQVRLLQLLTADGTRPAYGWDWGAADDWPYLPGVRHGRTVLSRARWLVRDPGVLDGAVDTRHWLPALRAWQRRWRVPDRVEVGTFDQRLPLDLARPADLALLRHELRRHPGAAVHAAVDPDGSGAGWLTGPTGGHHTAEISVPLLRRRAPASSGPRATPSTLRPPRHLPGGEWLFAKLYCPGRTQDTVLAHHLPGLLEGLPADVDRWFFVRYADPDPHLRLRLHGDPRTLTLRVLPALRDLAAGLGRLGLAGRLVLDTYEPETARYGGDPGALAAAERVFHADSAAALVHLRLLDASPPPVDPLLLAAAGRAHLAFHFTLPDDPADGPARARRLPALAPRGEHHGAFRARRREALRIIDPLGDFAALRAVPGTAPLLAAWAGTAESLSAYGRHLGPDAGPVLASLLHMHHNRVTADPSRSTESTVHALARGAVEAHLTRLRATTGP
ncbi:lantibiotic dehydratase [Streptomyces daghestanicus]|uniref:Lantibiotic dehydratase n=1 Tax=Streptomyces daghestanicus TaxID=66885 RepID=A0ABQ3Q503_9ACTN|nr:lantibiotic dehydratase [Streptomyces daghestanicus]GGU55171.1 lantibiotic dehydratase [Streptomyces daghestanicus]GHI32336.1 lantibiotic dehydratase [Streptomyces daghestanicus]